MTSSLLLRAPPKLFFLATPLVTGRALNKSCMNTSNMTFPFFTVEYNAAFYVFLITCLWFFFCCFRYVLFLWCIVFLFLDRPRNSNNTSPEDGKMELEPLNPNPKGDKEGLKRSVNELRYWCCTHTPQLLNLPPISATNTFLFEKLAFRCCVVFDTCQNNLKVVLFRMRSYP